MRAIFRSRRSLGQRAFVWRSSLSLTLSAVILCLLAAPAQSISPPSDYSFDLPCLTGGGDICFNDLAACGKPFMLVWWKSDCPHCLRELPYVQQLAELSSAGKLDLEVISINVDRSTDACLELADKRNLSFPILSDPEARKTDGQFAVWQGDGLPCTCLFGPGGDLVARLRSDQSDYVDKVLSNLGLQIVEHNPLWDQIATELGHRVQYLLKNRAAWLVYDQFTLPKAQAEAEAAAHPAASAESTGLKLGSKATNQAEPAPQPAPEPVTPPAPDAPPPSTP